MKKNIIIISGDPNSINSEIIAKVWRRREVFSPFNIIIVGSYDLLKKQFNKIGFKINIQKVSSIEDLNFKKTLHVFDVPLKFNNPFKVSSKRKKKYLENSFKTAVNLIERQKAYGLINCAIDKRDLDLSRKVYGITEYLAKKKSILGSESMLIYNKFLSVSPITTHIKLKEVNKNITKNKIIKKINTINNFFKTRLNKKPKIGILGLNPHNYELRKNSEELRIIKPAINFLKKRGVNVYGPISPDTSFLDYRKKKYDVLVGMYHDQVLTPFKSIYKFDAINVTLGLPFLRVSPDHGVGRDLILKNKANPTSLLESIKFFKKINVKA